jgi:hypothetical protein
VCAVVHLAPRGDVRGVSRAFYFSPTIQLSLLAF